ncbi:MAG: hypothetical protein V3S34_02665 [Hyphomicrobium sp.]
MSSLTQLRGNAGPVDRVGLAEGVVTLRLGLANIPDAAEDGDSVMTAPARSGALGVRWKALLAGSFPELSPLSWSLILRRLISDVSVLAVHECGRHTANMQWT